MRLGLVFCTLLWAWTPLLCQSVNDEGDPPAEEEATVIFPVHSLKLSVYPLINIGKTALDLATDRRLTPIMAGHLEVGYYLASHNFANEDGESYHGWRIRPGLKWDVGGVALGIMYKYENVDNKTYKEVNRQGGAFFQDLLIDRKVIIHGFQFTTSRIFKLSRNGKWIIEPFFRIGIQSIDVTYGMPDDAEIIDDFDVNIAFREGNSLRPDLYFGINIGLAWW